MKILINGLQYKRNSSGIGVLIRELFVPLTAVTRRSCRVVLSQDSPDFPAQGRAEEIRCPYKNGQGIRRMLFQTFTLGRRYARDSILLTTDSKIPLFLPRSCVPLPVITDLAVFRMPEVYQKSRVLWWRFQYRYLCRRARYFAAISEFTKREMTEILKIPPERIRVIPCAASGNLAPETDGEVLAAVRARYALPPQYVLFVGNNNPRKNLARLIRAFDRAVQGSPIPHRLVIAGEQGWKFDPETVLKDVQSRDRVHFIGFVPDGDMPALYSAASLFLFPTLYEGFGIPVLEAQLCGTRVLTSGCSALPEVGGEGAVYVDPLDEADICRGMLQVLQDPGLAGKLREKGFANAGRFSWERSARLLNEWIEEEVAL